MTNQERINDLNNSIKFWNEKLSITINNIDRGDLSERIRIAKEEINKLSMSPVDISPIVHSDATPIADRLEKGVNTRSGFEKGYITGNTNVFRFNI